MEHATIPDHCTLKVTGNDCVVDVLAVACADGHFSFQCIQFWHEALEGQFISLLFCDRCGFGL
jgi:hypothetical protein